MKWRCTARNNTNLHSDPAVRLFLLFHLILFLLFYLNQDLDKTLPIHNVTDEEIHAFVSADTTNSIKLMWIGHATSLVNIENCIIIIDPVFRLTFLLFYLVYYSFQ